MELKVLDNKGKETTAIQVNDAFTEAKGSEALLHEVVTAYRAGLRAGTHKTLTRSEVSGGGVKPWKQKRTGRARSGSIRSPLWRHGGIIFGPEPRDYRQDLPKKKKLLAFQMAVSHLLKENLLQVVEPIKISEPKTKYVADVYKKWQAPTDSLLVLDKIDPVLHRAARNIPNVRLVSVETLNTYDCLRARRVFITAAGLAQLSERLAKTGEKK